MTDFEEDNLIIDCPGQIELYIHSNSMKKIVNAFVANGYLVCGLYLLDSGFLTDTSKFFGGTLGAMAAMLQLSIPHLNVLTKMDLVGENVEYLDKYLNVDTEMLLSKLNQSNKSLLNLNKSLVQLVKINFNN